MAKPKRMSPRQCHLVIKSWSKRLPKNRIAKEAFVGTLFYHPVSSSY